MSDFTDEDEMIPEREARRAAIRTIESLWPPDHRDPATAEVGRELLDRARAEVLGWRTEPTAVLLRLAGLMMEHDGVIARTGNASDRATRAT